jgi:hypothetical protein
MCLMVMQRASTGRTGSLVLGATPVVVCRCMNGRFECSDELVPDGGVSDRPDGRM